MNASPRAARSLQLESLESRTLLAGGAGGFAADFALTIEAVSGTGDFEASFSLNFGNTQLVLTGQPGNGLTVDLDRLPAFVTNLRISTFSTVTFLGTDRVDNLVATDVGTILAPGLSVTKSLHLNDVGTANLASAGTIAVLKGTASSLTVPGLGDTMILSDLQSLTIDSESRALFLVGLNSDQLLLLKNRPETISLAGLTSASVHLLDELPATDGGSNGGSSDLGVPGKPPSPEAEPVVFITIPLDERTRALIAELRHLLHTSGADTQQLVFDFMAGGSLAASARMDAAASAPFMPPLELLPPEWAAVGTANPIGPDALESGAFRGTTLPGPGHISDRLTDRPLETTVVDSAAGFAAPPSVLIDATWPVALAAGPAREQPSAPAPLPDREVPFDEIKFEDTVRALGSFLVERVSAEYSAGQQSLILLVDPRPARSAGTNPTTALDTFARGGRTSLASLQQVMS